jgi:hypothetical protein
MDFTLLIAPIFQRLIPLYPSTVKRDGQTWTIFRLLISEICPIMITPSRLTTGWRTSRRQEVTALFSIWLFSARHICVRSDCMALRGMWFSWQSLWDSETALVANEFEVQVLRLRKWIAEAFHKLSLSVAQTGSRKSKFPVVHELHELSKPNVFCCAKGIRQSNSIPVIQLAEVFINAHLSQVDHLIFLVSAIERLSFPSFVESFCTEDDIRVDFTACLV